MIESWLSTKHKRPNIFVRPPFSFQRFVGLQPLQCFDTVVNCSESSKLQDS